MTDAKPKPDIRFHVVIRPSEHYGFDSHRYAHFTARAMVLSHDTGSPGLWSPDSYRIDTHGARNLDGLEITAQADSSTLRKPGREWYGWSVHYDRHRVELQAAEDIVKTLRAIDRRMRKLGGELGRPATLAQFCVYAAGAVTREKYAFMRDVRPEQDFEAPGYMSMNAGMLACRISSETTEIRKQLGIELSD